MRNRWSWSSSRRGSWLALVAGGVLVVAVARRDAPSSSGRSRWRRPPPSGCRGPTGTRVTPRARRRPRRRVVRPRSVDGFLDEAFDADLTLDLGAGGVGPGAPRARSGSPPPTLEWELFAQSADGAVADAPAAATSTDFDDARRPAGGARLHSAPTTTTACGAAARDLLPGDRRRRSRRSCSTSPSTPTSSWCVTSDTEALPRSSAPSSTGERGRGRRARRGGRGRRASRCRPRSTPAPTPAGQLAMSQADPADQDQADAAGRGRRARSTR